MKQMPPTCSENGTMSRRCWSSSAVLWFVCWLACHGVARGALQGIPIQGKVSLFGRNDALTDPKRFDGKRTLPTNDRPNRHHTVVRSHHPLRGGGGHSSGIPSFAKRLLEPSTKKIVWTTVGLVLSVLYVRNRAVVNQLFDKTVIRQTVLDLLHKVDPESPKGLLAYMAAFAVWEAIGLSTIPVETAAGMAFGFSRAVLGSVVGKLVGITIAFVLGRTVLQGWVRNQLQDNSVMALLDQEVERHPLRVATLLRYSVLPEFIVNFGSAILTPIRIWMYWAAMLVHGVPFSCLWALLGQDAALRLQPQVVVVPVNYALRAMIVFAFVVGFLSPLMMAWWVQSLRQQQQQQSKP